MALQIECQTDVFSLIGSYQYRRFILYRSTAFGIWILYGSLTLVKFLCLLIYKYISFLAMIKIVYVFLKYLRRHRKTRGFETLSRSRLWK